MSKEYSDRETPSNIPVRPKNKPRQDPLFRLPPDSAYRQEPNDLIATSPLPRDEGVAPGDSMHGVPSQLQESGHQKRKLSYSFDNEDQREFPSDKRKKSLEKRLSDFQYSRNLTPEQMDKIRPTLHRRLPPNSGLTHDEQTARHDLMKLMNKANNTPDAKKIRELAQRPLPAADMRSAASLAPDHGSLALPANSIGYSMGSLAPENLHEEAGSLHNRDVPFDSTYRNVLKLLGNRGFTEAQALAEISHVRNADPETLDDQQMAIRKRFQARIHQAKYVEKKKLSQMGSEPQRDSLHHRGGDPDPAPPQNPPPAYGHNPPS